MDDFVIYVSGSSPPSAERRLQLDIKDVVTLADLHGFRFSQTSTSPPAPSLFLRGFRIWVAEEAGFLGLLFDKLLLFGSYATRTTTSSICSVNFRAPFGVQIGKPFFANTFPLFFSNWTKGVVSTSRRLQATSGILTLYKMKDST